MVRRMTEYMNKGMNECLKERMIEHLLVGRKNGEHMNYCMFS